MMISVFMVIYLRWYKPMESPLTNMMETFNECTTIFLLYCLMCFTDFVPDEETRSKIGLFYIGVNLFHILVHLVFLALATCH